MNVRMIPSVEPRVETGPTQFGDDWPGVFIRGDNALIGTLPALRNTLTHLQNTKQWATYPLQIMIAESELKGLIELLESCAVNYSTRLP